MAVSYITLCSPHPVVYASRRTLGLRMWLLGGKMAL
jgi:hypothetical protein